MVAERDGVGPGVEEFLVDRFREAKAAGRVLAVGDHDVDVVLFADEREMFGERLATGSTDDVRNGEDRDILL